MNYRGMKRQAAIFLCDVTGIAAKPWADAGMECWCVDVRHSIRRERVDGLIHYVWGDVRSWCPPAGLEIVFMGAMPPCTDVAVSGARDFQAKRNYLLSDALELFAACELACSYAQCPYWIENPVGVLSTHMRKPDYAFQPWQYGDKWFKKTCLWTGGGFVMPEPLHATPPDGTTEKIWLMAPSDERAGLRSETPPGFARAVFTANWNGVRPVTRAVQSAMAQA